MNPVNLGNDRLSYQMVVIRKSIAAGGCQSAIVALLLAFAAALLSMEPAKAAGEQPASARLQVPRFVSLKSDRVNARGGPSRDQTVRWVYTRAGMPVEIVAEFENWRRIRDWEGAEGWVYHALLSGKRTAVVVPKDKEDLVPLYESADAESQVVARLQSGVLMSLKSCGGKWCRVSGNNFAGYIRQERLWGAYPNEKVD